MRGIRQHCALLSEKERVSGPLPMVEGEGSGSGLLLLVIKG